MSLTSANERQPFKIPPSLQPIHSCSIAASFGAIWIDLGLRLTFGLNKVSLVAMLIHVIINLLTFNLLYDFDHIISILLGTYLNMLLFSGVICAAEQRRKQGKTTIPGLLSGMTMRAGKIFGLYLLFIGLLMLTITGWSASIWWILFQELIFTKLISLTDIIELWRYFTPIKLIISIVISLLAITVLLCLYMLCGFTVALMTSRHLPLFKSILASVIGCLKNIPAIVVYIICLAMMLSVYGLFLEVVPLSYKLLVSYITFSIFSIMFFFLPVYAAHLMIFPLPKEEQ